MAQKRRVARQCLAVGPIQHQHHALPKQQPPAFPHNLQARRIGAAIQRQRQRHRLLQKRGVENHHHRRINQRRGGGRERGNTEQPMPAQRAGQLHQHECDRVGRLQRAAKPGQYAHRQRRPAWLPLALQFPHEKHEVRQHRGRQQMLPLAKLHPRQQQQQGPDHREGRHTMRKQRRPAAQQTRRPPGERQHQSGEERAGDNLGFPVEMLGNPGRNGVNPDNQRRIDLNEVFIQPLPAQPFPGDIQQPGHVILQRG